MLVPRRFRHVSEVPPHWGWLWPPDHKPLTPPESPYTAEPLDARRFGYILGGGAFGGFVLPSPMGLIAFLGAILVLGGFAVYETAKTREATDTANLVAGVAPNTPYWQAQWHKWLASRALAVIADDPHPARKAAQLIKQLGTIYLGVSSDVYQQLMVVPRNKSVIVLAPAQSGKTRGLAAPAIMTHPGPVIATSTKVDLIDLTALARVQRGRVWIFDPLHSIEDCELPQLPYGAEPVRVHWSPLWGITGWDSARLTARSLIGATALGQGGLCAAVDVENALHRAPDVGAVPDVCVGDATVQRSDRNAGVEGEGMAGVAGDCVQDSQGGVAIVGICPLVDVAHGRIRVQRGSEQ